MEVEVLGVFPSWEEATYQPETIFQTVSLSQSEMVFQNSWFVQLGEASSLLAWMEWPVLSWKNTADVLETQHAINGHLSWITHSKMSARLRAATFFPSFQSCERGEAGSLLSPCSYTRMHHSWAGNNIHTLKMMPGVKGRHIAGCERMIIHLKVCFLERFGLFWSGSLALQSVLDLQCKHSSHENLGSLKFWKPSVQVSGDILYAQTSNLFLSTQVVDIHTDQLLKEFSDFLQQQRNP